MGKLFGGKDQTKVMRIDLGVVVTSLFRVDVPSSSESIRLHPEFSRLKADSHIELAKVLGPACLAAGEDLGGSKIFQVLVVGDNIDQSGGTFKIVSPDSEGFKNC
jgi:hypothetical protein